MPRREQLDDAGRRTYDSLADPKGGTIRGLSGPCGILLHSPELSRHARPLNRVHPQIASAKLRALAEGAELASRALWRVGAHR